jgi:hypothetical protein
VFDPQLRAAGVIRCFPRVPRVAPAPERMRGSRGLDGKLSPHQVKLTNLQQKFSSKTKWGHFDASSMIGALKNYIGYKEIDA